ncbi:MAG: FAD-binding oxidoreductase [Chloroflexi bacterium]|nr:FAD-binding oxidoreductase [Chloroflexota bacterium]
MTFSFTGSIFPDAMVPKTADVVVIGGGCMGASVAYHLAARGVKNITLLEREKFLGMGSTRAAAGGVRYQFSTRVNIQLSLYSLPIIEHFQDHFGTSSGYHPIGYLFLLSDAREVAAFKRNLALQHSLGLNDICWLDRDEIARRAPRVNLDGIVGGTFGPRDGLADPNTITQAFAARAKALGARIETEIAVTGIRRENNRDAAVHTNRGEIATRTVVCCAGAWSPEIGRMIDIEIPIVPMRRQFFITDPLPQIPSDHPFTIDFASSFYFHPEGAGLIVGMSNHDETPGYKLAVDEAFREKTLEHAIQRVPLLADAKIASEIVGLYEVTPDAHPILSEAKAAPGFYIAAGFSGHGFMHSPAAGKVMSEIILDGKSSTVDVSMLDLERFAEGRLVQEVNVV